MDGPIEKSPDFATESPIDLQELSRRIEVSEPSVSALLAYKVRALTGDTVDRAYRDCEGAIAHWEELQAALHSFRIENWRDYIQSVDDVIDRLIALPRLSKDDLDVVFQLLTEVDIIPFSDPNWYVGGNCRTVLGWAYHQMNAGIRSWDRIRIPVANSERKWGPTARGHFSDNVVLRIKPEVSLMLQKEHSAALEKLMALPAPVQSDKRASREKVQRIPKAELNGAVSRYLLLNPNSSIEIVSREVGWGTTAVQQTFAWQAEMVRRKAERAAKPTAVKLNEKTFSSGGRGPRAANNEFRRQSETQIDELDKKDQELMYQIREYELAHPGASIEQTIANLECSRGDIERQHAIQKELIDQRRSQEEEDGIERPDSERGPRRRRYRQV